MRTFLTWIGVFAAATAVDLFVRFGLPFQLTRVLAVEALLFPATGLAYLLLFSRKPATRLSLRRLQMVIVASFFLAGVRSGLWAAGMPIGKVNIIVLGLAALTLVALRVRHRCTHRPGS